MYTYFIYYTFTGNTIGDGNVDVVIKGKIDGMDIIRELEERIGDKNELESVVINNWILLSHKESA